MTSAATRPAPTHAPVPVHGRRATYLLLGALALIWGGHWAVTKVGLHYVPPFTYSTIRVVIGLAALLAILAARGRVVRPGREDLPVVLAVGLGQMAATMALISLALQFVPAGRSAILQYTMPLWAAAIQLAVYRTRLTGREVAGLLLGIAGVGVLLNPATIDWRSPEIVLGSGMLLLGAVIWAATTILLRRHAWRSPPLELIPWELLVALVPLTVMTLIFERGRAIEPDLVVVPIVAFSGLLATAFAYYASQSITRSLSPMGTTVSFLAVPVVGLASGAIALGEPLSVLDIVGFATVAAGIACVSSRAAPSPEIADASPWTSPEPEAG